jgi:sulfur-carrier protein
VSVDDPSPNTRIRVAMPHQLRSLAHVTDDVIVEVDRLTLGAVLDALEDAHPVLRGTIRNRTDGRRRPMIRIYAGGTDYSDAGPEVPLPDVVATGREPLRLVGAIAGG